MQPFTAIIYATVFFASIFYAVYSLLCIVLIFRKTLFVTPYLNEIEYMQQPLLLLSEYMILLPYITTHSQDYLLTH